MNQPPNPYGAPVVQPAMPHHGEQYADVPIYRRNGPCSALLFAALILAFVGPFLLSGVAAALGSIGPTVTGALIGAPLFAVCLVVLTGPVFFDEYETPGKLKRWGIANKVVAALILGGWVVSIVATLL